MTLMATEFEPELDDRRTAATAGEDLPQAADPLPAQPDREDAVDAEADTQSDSDADDEVAVAPELSALRSAHSGVADDRRSQRHAWLIALSASVLLHGLSLGGLVILFRRGYTPPRLHFASLQSPGTQGSLEMDPTVNESAVMESAEKALAVPAPVDPLVAPRPAVVAKPTVEVPQVVTPSIAVAIAPPDAAEPMIGLHSSDSPLPHFAPPTFHVQATGSATTQPALAQAVTLKPGGTAHHTQPPRMAGQEGNGSHAAKNGYDSRGVPIPDYPAESRRRGEQGLAVLDVEVLPSGDPGTIQVVTDPGYKRLVDAAIDAVRQARFEPAQTDGRPVEGHLKIPFRFVLQK